MERETAAQPPVAHTVSLRVRHADIDQLGHVSSPIYLHYAMEAAFLHAEATGFGMERWRELGGTFVVRRHEIEYHRPAFAGDELLVTTRVTSMRGMRATRGTIMVNARSGKAVATATTDFVWVNANGRPAHIPAAVLAAFPVDER